jgi:CMP-N-acetylneuraminic acid synthetase
MRTELLQAIESNLTYAIIPARSGSKGVKDKNIRKLAGYPLLAYSIATARMVPSVSRVLVSTDSPSYAEIAKSYGAEVPFLRPPPLSSDESPDEDFMIHAIDWLYDNEGRLPEYWLHLRPTSPLRAVAILEDALQQMKKDGNAVCLRSAGKAPGNPHKWYVLNETGHYFNPILPDMPIKEANNPRQSYPAAYIPDGNVDVLKSRYIIENDAIHGNSMLALIVEKLWDIDTESDFCDVEKAARESEAYALLTKGSSP